MLDGFSAQVDIKLAFPTMSDVGTDVLGPVLWLPCVCVHARVCI